MTINIRKSVNPKFYKIVNSISQIINIFFQRYKLCAATHLDIEYRSLIFSFIDNVKPSPDKAKGKFKTLDLIDN